MARQTRQEAREATLARRAAREAKRLRTRMSKETPHVWVGSLAAYNNGELLGEWFEAADCPTNAIDWIDAMVAAGAAPPRWRTHLDEQGRFELALFHEELWVFTHEGFGQWLKGECSPAEAQELAELIESLGDDADAAGAYLRDYVGGKVSDFDETDFRDHYRGEYDSESAYADEIIEERLASLKAMLEHGLYDKRTLGFAVDTLEWLNGYVDSSDVARELSMGGTTFVDSGRYTVYVFES